MNWEDFIYLQIPSAFLLHCFCSAVLRFALISLNSTNSISCQDKVFKPKMGLKCVWIFILWPLGYNSHVLVKFGLLSCQGRVRRLWGQSGLYRLLTFKNVDCCSIKSCSLYRQTHLVCSDRISNNFLGLYYSFKWCPKKIHLSKRKGFFKSYLLNQKLYIHDCSDWQEFLLHGSPFHKFHRTIYLFTLYDT